MANCVNCGAPMRKDEVSGALVCGHCGTFEEPPALVRDLVLEDLSAVPCPICGTALTNARLDGHPLLQCQQCSGMLIAMDLFVPVIEAARQREERSGVSLPRRQKPGDRVLSCPTCSTPMLSHFYAGPGNLVIDTCERCRVNWLDAGELRRIARAPQGRLWSPPPPLEAPDPGDEEAEDE